MLRAVSCVFVWIHQRLPFQTLPTASSASLNYTINATKGGNVFYRSPRHLAHSTSSTRFRKAEGEEASQHPGRLKLTGKASAPGGSTSGMLSTASLLQFRSGPPPTRRTFLWTICLLDLVWLP
uniref:Uncharacterized protein n=1 Tax=Rousettus aegyptiacus TaxID=9407 RepID=A0A7J8BFC2_ROUAE|nr:hypothetical protein HJG63_009837 [Rousettus aegyptiacus]